MAPATLQQTASVPQPQRHHRRHRRFRTYLRITDWRKAAVYVLFYSIAVYVVWKL